MPEARSHAARRSRCRCGHLLTHHMIVAPAATTANFRLDPSGPCELCGEGVCRRFTPVSG